MHDPKQLEAWVREFSYLMGEYYRGLIKEEFTPDQALQIVLEWQMNVMMNGEK